MQGTPKPMLQIQKKSRLRNVPRRASTSVMDDVRGGSSVHTAATAMLWCTGYPAAQLAQELGSLPCEYHWAL